MADRYADLPLTTRRFLEVLSDQRVANILLASDVFGDMDADTLRIIRNLKPELLKFLGEMREDEIEELQNSIELVRAFRRTGRVVRWSVGTLFATFVGVMLVWDKVSAWFKTAR
jgi:hypothetical protein